MIRLLIFLVACLTTAAARASDCALGLVLALDISSSVNSYEYDVQKDGLAAALRHEDIRAILLSEPGTIRIAAFEWSGEEQKDMIASWTQIITNRDIDALATRIEAHERRFTRFSTALGEALRFGESLFNDLPAPCRRQVIDVSGDGVSNEGMTPAEYRTMGGLRRVTVNGLVMKGESPDPEAYYRDEGVIGGPGAFMMVARNGFQDYPDLILGKLLRELRPPVFVGAAPSGHHTR